MNDSDKLRGMEPNGCDAERASDTGDTLTAEKKAWDKLDCDAPDCDARACAVCSRRRSRRFLSVLGIAGSKRHNKRLVLTRF